MTVSTEDLQEHPIAGVRYQLRTPSVFDPSRMRRILTREGVRRPTVLEFKVAALAGVTAMAEAVGDEAEGERQKAIVEEWYALLEPLSEDDIDDPDLVSRGAEFARRLAERRARQVELMPDVLAIEANLERHSGPYRELIADRNYWDEISAIEIVRLLLIAANDVPYARAADGMLTEAAYTAIPPDHRASLATFAKGLLAPTKATEKN